MNTICSQVSKDLLGDQGLMRSGASSLNQCVVSAQCQSKKLINIHYNNQKMFALFLSCFVC